MINKLFYISGLLSGLGILAIMLLTLAKVILRLFSVHLPASEAIAGFILINSFFCGLAYCFYVSGHIRVSVLVDHIPRRWAQWLDLLSHGCALLISLFMTYSFIQFSVDSYLFHELTTDQLAMPQWALQAPIVLSCLLFNLSIAYHLKQRVSDKNMQEGH